MGVRIVTEREYRRFIDQIEVAEEMLNNREKHIEQVYSEFETQLVLLGATAVEDRLQEEVMETIQDMQTADIKVWMLTGDKFETAENIGISCGLLKPQVHTYGLNWSEGSQW